MVVEFGKMLVMVGIVVAVLGGLLWASGGTLRLFPPGSVTGDIVVRGGESTFYFPVVTSIVLSVLLSALLWLVGRIGS